MGEEIFMNHFSTISANVIPIYYILIYHWSHLSNILSRISAFVCMMVSQCSFPDLQYLIRFAEDTEVILASGQLVNYSLFFNSLDVFV